MKEILKKKNMNFANRIIALNEEDLKEINKILKILESDLRIVETEISQIKKGFKKLKERIE